MAADKLDQKIGDELRRITGAGSKRRFPVMSGVVTAVDSGEMTCTVQLTADAEDTPTDGILLNVLLENTNGMYMLPVVDANCVVCEVDGPGQLKQLLWADSYTKVQVTVGSSQLTVIDGNVEVAVGNSQLTVTSDQIEAVVGGSTKLTMTSSGHKIEAGGQDLGTALQNLLTHIMAITVPTGTGPSGIPNNLADFLSDATTLSGILV
jgi:hypothetical protein